MVARVTCLGDFRHVERTDRPYVIGCDPRAWPAYIRVVGTDLRVDLPSGRATVPLGSTSAVIADDREWMGSHDVCPPGTDRRSRDLRITRTHVGDRESVALVVLGAESDGAFEIDTIDRRRPAGSTCAVDVFHETLASFGCHDAGGSDGHRLQVDGNIVRIYRFLVTEDTRAHEDAVAAIALPCGFRYRFRK
jgi:hypothetical protein